MSEDFVSKGYDPKSPPGDVFHKPKYNSRFYMSKGEFPEEISILFNTPRSVKSVALESQGIKKIIVHTSRDSYNDNYEVQAEQDDCPKGTQHQNIILNLPKSPTVKAMKIQLIEGYGDFFTIHGLDIE